MNLQEITQIKRARQRSISRVLAVFFVLTIAALSGCSKSQPHKIEDLEKMFDEIYPEKQMDYSSFRTAYSSHSRGVTCDEKDVEYLFVFDDSASMKGFLGLQGPGNETINYETDYREALLQLREYIAGRVSSTKHVRLSSGQNCQMYSSDEDVSPMKPGFYDSKESDISNVMKNFCVPAEDTSEDLCKVMVLVTDGVDNSSSDNETEGMITSQFIKCTDEKYKLGILAFKSFFSGPGYRLLGGIQQKWFNGEKPFYFFVVSPNQELLRKTIADIDDLLVVNNEKRRIYLWPATLDEVPLLAQEQKESKTEVSGKMPSYSITFEDKNIVDKLKKKKFGKYLNKAIDIYVDDTVNFKKESPPEKIDKSDRTQNEPRISVDMKRLYEYGQESELDLHLNYNKKALLNTETVCVLIDRSKKPFAKEPTDPFFEIVNLTQEIREEDSEDDQAPVEQLFIGADLLINNLPEAKKDLACRVHVVPQDRFLVLPSWIDQYTAQNDYSDEDFARTLFLKNHLQQVISELEKQYTSYPLFEFYIVLRGE